MQKKTYTYEDMQKCFDAGTKFGKDIFSNPSNSEYLQSINQDTNPHPGNDYTDYRSPLGNAAQEIIQHILKSLGCEHYNTGCENKLCSQNFQEKLKFGTYKDTPTYRHIRFELDLIIMMKRGTLLKLEIKGSLDKHFTISKPAYDTYMENINATILLKKHGMKHIPRSIIVFTAPDNIYAQYIHKLKFQKPTETFSHKSLTKKYNIENIEEYWINPHSLPPKILELYKNKTHSSCIPFARIDKKASNLKKLIRPKNIEQYQKLYLETMQKHNVPLNEKTLSKFTKSK